MTDTTDRQWRPTPRGPIDSVTFTCTVCGWQMTMREGDPPIPHNDPRLQCPHT